ncbi:MAG: leucine-rich repeat protein, partial [Oscillospiraceae bacterium]|nr:leucine-rich repeat protein [Oscillospiraceae bacterium]
IDLGKKVSYLGKRAFAQTLSLSKLTLSDNIEFIGDDALWNATYTQLVIPATVENIPATFYNVKNLKKIIVDTENKTYSSDEKGVLYNKDKSELIKCPTSIELDKYSIVNTAKTIKTSAFNGTGMATLGIPESVTTIEKDAIKSSNLKTIEGYTGSYAETFAAENKYEFVSLGEAVSTPTDPDTPVTPPSTEGKFNYDVDGNGSINVMDLVKLKKYLLS